MVIVLVVTNLFDQASRNWNTGVDNAELNNAARAAIDLMTRELESAVAGPIDSDQLRGATNFLFRINPDGNEVQFISLTETPSSVHRALRAVRYTFNPPLAGDHINTLNRAIVNQAFAAYTNESWIAPSGFNDNPMAERLSDFYMEPFDDNGTSWLPAVTSSNRLPAYMDIHMKIVSREAYEIYSSMGKEPHPGYLENNSRIYSTRVYFANRNGYRN